MNRYWEPVWIFMWQNLKFNQPFWMRPADNCPCRRVAVTLREERNLLVKISLHSTSAAQRFLKSVHHCSWNSSWFKTIVVLTIDMRWCLLHGTQGIRSRVCMLDSDWVLQTYTEKCQVPNPTGEAMTPDEPNPGKEGPSISLSPSIIFHAVQHLMPCKSVFCDVLLWMFIYPAGKLRAPFRIKLALTEGL